MANSDKDIVITPNKGQAANPSIVVTGADNTPGTLTVNNDGSLTFDKAMNIGGTVNVSKNISQGNNLTRPLSTWGVTGTSTGMVIISFPGGAGNYGMIHAVIDIYEYSGNAASTVIVGGHNWSSAWYNANANVVGQTDKAVRVGFKDGKYCIVLGTATSSWSYGSVVLRKIHNGDYYNDIMDMDADFVITQTATESFTWVSSDLRELKTPLTFTAGQDVRAPLFYDSNDTTYYLDPASTTSLRTVGSWRSNSSAWDGEFSGKIQYHGNHWYLQAANSWIFRNSSAIDVFTVNQSGSATAIADFRAPIFYDSANTAFYVDPASTSILNIIGNGVKFSVPGDTTVSFTNADLGDAHFSNRNSRYLTSNGANWAADGKDVPLTISSSITDDDRGRIGIVLHNEQSTTNAMTPAIAWGSKSDSGAYNSIYALIQAKKTGIGVDGNWNSGELHFYTMTAGAYVADDPGIKFWNNGDVQARLSMRAPIFYDSNDTAYYVDPNSTSSMWNVNIRGDLNSTATGNQLFLWGNGSTTSSAIGFKGNGGNFPNPTGNGDGYNTYLTMDTEGRGWVFRRGTGGTDFTSAYNSGWILNNGIWQANASMRAPIFYDSNDTGFYVDPTSTSILNAVRTINSYDSSTTRFVNPSGGAYTSSASSISGAIKIKLPVAKNNSSTMMTFTVEIYQYSTGRSHTFKIGGYNYVLESWYNVFAINLSDDGEPYTVRFGRDGTSDCIWIGETNSVWYYPQIFVTDFHAGYSGQDANWGTGWGISIVTAFDTVEASRQPPLLSNNIRVTGDVTAYYSDERLKTFDGKITNALEKVNSINGYYFYENDVAKSLGYKNDQRQLGVSAQEIERILPEAVTTAPISSEYLTVKYDRLVPLLIEAVKEQQKIIKDQNDRLTQLEQIVNKLVNKD